MASLVTSSFRTVSRRFHASAAVNWQIPERLAEIPESMDPNFFNMVEYYFHKACSIAEPTLMEDMASSSIEARQSSDEKTKSKVHGILRIIEPCAHILETNFPVQRDDGNVEIVTAYRAQHSHHRTPCKVRFET